MDRGTIEIIYERLQADRQSSQTTETNSECLQSRNLSEALNKIGANQNVRKKYEERNTIQLLGYEFYWLNENGESCRRHRRIQEKFGSYIEGTTTPGLKLDRYDIFIELAGDFEEGFGETSMVDEKCVVIVSDMFTPPGFVKIRVNTIHKWESFELQTTRSGNSFMTNIYTEKYIQDLKNLVHFGEDLKRKGPALTHYFKDGQLESLDIIGALHNKRILSYNQAFFNRRRLHGWPSEQTMAKMKEQGCLLVPTGHRFCDESSRNLQWRISFSFQERHIMLNLKDTQHKCYILLKLMKKAHISPHVRLSSYQCKTSLFYTMENTPENLWTNDNLMTCFIRCLKLLRKWSKKGFCPSFFIPEVNLFTGKINSHELERLSVILATIIADPMHFIFKIETDNYGKLVRLYETGSSDENIEHKANNIAFEEIKEFNVAICTMFLRIRTALLRKITYHCRSVNEAIERHLTWLKTLEKLQDRNKVAHIQLKGIPWALPHVSRFLHTSLASHLALKAVETKNETENSWLSLAAAFHFWKGMKSDATSSRIKLASVLPCNGNNDANDWNSHYKLTEGKIPICGCRYTNKNKDPRRCDAFRKLYLSSPNEALKMCTSKFLKKYVSACIVYLPTEASLTPYPLQFEMYRGFGSKASPLEVNVENNYKISCVDLGSCVTIDSKAFCLLMAVLLSTGEKRKGFMKLLTSTAQSMKHRETLLNVLGWLESAEQINPKSLILYKQSWDYHENMNKYTQPFWMTTDRNAAKWHLALFLYRAWKIIETEC